MRKLDQLFVRACKSKDPKKRLLSVYRRFYLDTDEDPVPYISSILLTITEEFNLLSARALIAGLKQAKLFSRLLNEEEEEEFEQTLFGILMTTIRFTPGIKLPGLSIPCKFKETKGYNHESKSDLL